MPEILVVEDDLELADAVSEVLALFGFRCRRARSLAEARPLAESVDLVLLDLGLADGDGMELCRSLQGRKPVIVMTARGGSADRVSTLEGGADDYVAKPFDARELVARCRAVLRRTTGTIAVADVVLDGRLVISPSRGFVTLDAEAVSLTIKERELLFALARRRGAMVPRPDLIREVWGLSAQQGDNTLRVHLSSLRRKLDDDPTNPRFLVTVRGAGVRLKTEE
ncbi:MAG: response regulator transcription factor [Acidimicrobiales bacterium]